MSKYNWSQVLQAQRDSGLSVKAYCSAQNLTRSQFYAARAQAQKLATGFVGVPKATPPGLLPIRVVPEPAEDILITLDLTTRWLRLRGSAADLAQLVRCL